MQSGKKKKKYSIQEQRLFPKLDYHQGIEAVCESLHPSPPSFHVCL